MRRLFSCPLGLVIVMVICGATIARADVGPSVKVRLVRELTGPAVPGQEYTGTFEVLVGASGTLDSIVVDGDGWQGLEVDAANPIRVREGDALRFNFSGTPGWDTQGIRIGLRFDDRPVVRQFDLSPERFARSGKASRVASLDETGRVVPFGAKLSGARNTAGGQVIRFHGRLAYQRPTSPTDATLITVGADNMYFEIKDDDPPPSDDTIYAGFTDPFGYFDVTVNWEDCVITCDVPDIYIRWETDDNVVTVQSSDLLEENYSWSTEDNVINDFTGSEIDFGTLMPANAGQHPAIHIHNSIIRAHRYILALDGSNVPHVDVQWPESIGNCTCYNPTFEEIHIGPDQQWIEGTHTHEYGHHFLENFSQNLTPDYCNGYCDSPSCSHCVWCRETNHDAWNEGFPNWLGYVVNQTYILDYGITPYSIDDGRYTLETPQPCSQDSTPCTTDADCPGGTCGTAPPRKCFVMHDPYITEGFLAALLRDIVDTNPIPPALLEGQTGPSDCQCDAMSIGVKPIFTVVRLDQPTNPADFIRMFWNRYPEYRQDYWSTVLNIFPLPVPGMDFSLEPPIILSQTEGCQVYLAPEPIVLHVQGNGSLLKYQWRRNFVPLAEVGNVEGTQTPTLTISPSSAADGGIYDCVVTTCDGTLSTNSVPFRISVFAARGTGTNGGSWGNDFSGALGRGIIAACCPTIDGTPAPMAALANVVKMARGPTNVGFQLALLADGDVWSWGDNDFRELARPDVVNPSETATPGPIVDAQVHDIIDIATGLGHSMALTAGGNVLVWGDNYYAQHGNGNDDGSWPDRDTQVTQVPNLDCVVSIAAGSLNCAAVTSDGRAWTWGVDFGTFSTLPVIRPRAVPGITDAVAVAAGAYHTLVLRSNGVVMAFGNNDAGQLGDGTRGNRRSEPMPVMNLSNVQAIRAGWAHSLAILQDGTVRGWGVAKTLGVDISTGTILLPVQPLYVGQVVDVEGGEDHTMFLKADGTVWTTGENLFGELGPREHDGPVDTRWHPDRVVDIHNAKGIAAIGHSSYVLADGMGPQIVSQPGAAQRDASHNIQVVSGQSISLPVRAVGSPNLVYEWLLNNQPVPGGADITGADTPTLTIYPVQASLAGAYSVFVENDFGAMTSDNTNLLVRCARGDTDCNGRMDLSDAGRLIACISGPGNHNRPANCSAADFAAADMDHDNDVDMKDVALFFKCFSGPNQPMPPACANF